MQELEPDPLIVMLTRLGNEHELGKLRESYNQKNLRNFTIFAFIYLALALFLTLLGLLYGDGWMTLFEIGIFFPLVFFGARPLFTYAHEWEATLHRYEYGLAQLRYHRGELVHTDVIHWQDIAMIWHKIQFVQVIWHFCRLQRHDGTIFIDQNLAFPIRRGWLVASEGFDLVDCVEKEVQRVLWPGILDAYQQGQSIAFGMLTVSQKGIQYKDKLLTWSELSSIRYARAQVMIIEMQLTNASKQKTKRWPLKITIPLKQVANLYTLRMLLAFVREQNTTAAFHIQGLGLDYL